MLPKRFNVEQRFWDTAPELVAWRESALRQGGASASPSLEDTVVMHYVGRDKPWMRRDRPSSGPDSSADLCRKLRNHDEATCTIYLRMQALWWWELGRGSCIVVGEGAKGQRQGFVVESFEHVLRLDHASLPASDVGNLSMGVACPGIEQCATLADGLKCEQYTIGLTALQARRFPAAQPLLQVYKPKLGIFGGPAV